MWEVANMPLQQEFERRNRNLQCVDCWVEVDSLEPDFNTLASVVKAGFKVPSVSLRTLSELLKPAFAELSLASADWTYL